MNANILDIKDLSVKFETMDGQFSAVRDLNLSIGKDQSIGIIGESGCGKSTLSFSIMRYLAPNATVDGSIEFKGDSLLDKTDKELEKYRGNRMAMVFQNPYSSLNPALTIGFQLDEVGIKHQNLSKEQARKASIEALKLMNIGDPQGIVLRYPHQVSGGIQQRISIASAILCRPDLMILDEPTTALDVTTEAVILDSISELKEKLGMSLIYISHDMGVINKVAEQVVVMYSGEIVEKGPKEMIFDHPQHPYTRALINCMPRGGVVKENTKLNTIKGYVKQRGVEEGGCPFAPRCEKRNATCEAEYGMKKRTTNHWATCDRAYATDIPDIEYKNAPIKRDDIEKSKELLKIEDVHKVYPGKRKTYAVNGINISLNNSTVIGIVGESGCGKSTLGHMVSGLYKPTKGKIIFDENDISIGWNKRTPDMLKNIQLIFQNPGRSLNPSHTVESIIGRPMKQLSKIKSSKERRKKIIELLKRVDLGVDYLEKKPNQLSGGEQQRVAIARALSIEPQLVVCDEPTSALDVSVQAAVLNLLNELQVESKAAYMFISHDLNVINYLSDYIMVLYGGKVCEYGKRDEVMNNNHHPYTTALLSAVPEVDPKKQKKSVKLGKRLNDPAKKPKGCPFAGRCPVQVGKICEEVYPPQYNLTKEHFYNCHIAPNN
ncbi:MAG: dipeptide ABC transporter ATP-binding protein [Sphaerochaetaceae bacterium]|jgi:peptide/nickel transport system ATP-binding protein